MQTPHRSPRLALFRAALLAVAIVPALARALFARLAEALSPPSCAACDARVERSRAFCASCAATVVRADPTEDGDLAFAIFGGAVADALRRFKYEERPDLARPLGHLMRRALREAPGFGGADLVVPVPLHPGKLAERGFNQSALLGGAAATELGVPLAATALRRVRETAQQARLGKEERKANVAQAFEVRQARTIRGKTILLVDDVATTGATLSACRQVLLGAGAADVICLCLARALRSD